MGNIRLNHIQFTKVKLDIKQFDPNIAISNPVLDVGALAANSEEINQFGIRIAVSLNDKKRRFNLNVECIAHFDIDEKVNRDFVKSDMVRINAPAIAFPFVRTFIATLTNNAGYNPIYLPTYNFVEISKQYSKNEGPTDFSLKRKRAAKITKSNLPD